MLAKALALCALVGVAEAAHTYKEVGDGGCRGNGGQSDKVEGRSRTDLADDAACRKECDAVTTCTGYAFNTNNKYCIIYGKGMAGACSDLTLAGAVKGPDGCGTCSSPAIAEFTDGGMRAPNHKSECGTCSKPNATLKAACEALDGSTWTVGTWTAKTWNAPASPWDPDWHITTHVHSSTGTTGYKCYDTLKYDGYGTCTGTATDTTATPDCSAAYLAKNTFAKGDCPAGCTWSNAPKKPKWANNPHPKAMDSTKIPGYLPAQPGACRGGPDGAGKVQGKYFKQGDGDQKTCAHACDIDPDCTAYHSGPWCSIFGKGTEDGATKADEKKCAAPHNVPPYLVNGVCSMGTVAGPTGHETVSATKVNIEYMCHIKCPKTGCPAIKTSSAPGPASPWLLGALAGALALAFL